MGSTEVTQVSAEKINELYESVKPMIWLVEATGKVDGTPYVARFTAFAVREDGHLLTCTQGWEMCWTEFEKLKIKARRLDDNVKHVAEVVVTWPRWDMALLKLPISGLKCAKLASGTLGVGETLLLVGHPYEFVGSGMISHTVYPCISNPELPKDDGILCDSYFPNAWKKIPHYRILGHIWNELSLDAMENSGPNLYYPFLKSLYAEVPVIQTSGGVAGDGCSGAPLFDMRGKVVGMHACAKEGYEIAIHVSALRAFRDTFVPKIKKGTKGESSSSKGKDKEES